MPKPPIEGLYALTPEGIGGDGLLDKVEAALRGGLRLLQFRDKSNARDERLRVGRQLLDACVRSGAAFIVNDDPELAVELGAHGVHLGRDDGSIAAARRMLGAGAVIGASCYDDLDRALRLRADGADYVAFGSFFPSAVKPHAARPGLDLLRRARAKLDCPIVAIGGITRDNAPLVRAAGADAVAVITDVFSAPDIGARVRDYGRLFQRAATPG